MIIAGPCSAESYEQLEIIAQALVELGIKKMRLGAWKPRSRPNSFEGHGVKAIEWAREIQSNFGVEVFTEVNFPEDVECCLENNIQSFWIGARTTTNPFMVSKLAKSFEGREVRNIIVKNPIAPDLKLWIGAIERLSGVTDNIFACLRGFSTYSLSGFRNEPLWDIAVELKKKFPTLQTLVDPSHISGDKLLINDSCQMAMDFNFDGLMIEVHPRPQEALSDSEQQIDLNEFKTLLSNLEVKTNIDKDSSISKDIAEELSRARAEIQLIDEEVLSLLLARLNLSKEISLIKKQYGLSVLSLSQFDACLRSRISEGEKIGLPRELSEKYYRLIHSYSIKSQSLNTSL